VDADEAVPLLPLVEGGDVGKADEGPPWRAGGRQSLQKPHCSVAAAGTEDRSYAGVCESVIQFREPALIVAGEIPMPPENAWVVLNAVAIGNDGQSRVE
jgi:hypothetical protein